MRLTDIDSVKHVYILSPAQLKASVHQYDPLRRTLAVIGLETIDYDLSIFHTSCEYQKISELLRTLMIAHVTLSGPDRIA